MKCIMGVGIDPLSWAKTNTGRGKLFQLSSISCGWLILLGWCQVGKGPFTSGKDYPVVEIFQFRRGALVGTTKHVIPNSDNSVYLFCSQEWLLF